jgi:hypothetical protein
MPPRFQVTRIPTLKQVLAYVMFGLVIGITMSIVIR